eukprot:5738682-Amphidinium_carterae.2
MSPLSADGVGIIRDMLARPYFASLLIHKLPATHLYLQQSAANLAEGLPAALKLNAAVALAAEPGCSWNVDDTCQSLQDNGELLISMSRTSWLVSKNLLLHLAEITHVDSWAGRLVSALLDFRPVPSEILRSQGLVSAARLQARGTKHPLFMPKFRSTVSVSCSSFFVSELASCRIGAPHFAFDGTVVPVGSSILRVKQARADGGKELGELGMTYGENLE